MRERLSSRVRVVFLFVLACSMLGGLPAEAFSLPAGRAYEMVSPIYKGGYGANSIDAVAPGGETIAFTSLGAFAGDPANNAVANDYLARRTSSGWSTTPLTAPATLVPHAGVIDFSATLQSTLTEGKPGVNAGTASYESIELEFLLHDSSASNAISNFEVAGMPLKALDERPLSLDYLGASQDFSHIFFHVETGKPLVEEAENTRSTLYDLTTQASGDATSLQLVGLNNQAKIFEPNCEITSGAASGKDSSFNAIAADGGEVFFTLGVGKECRGQLFVRIDGLTTLEISRPKSSKCTEVPCAGSTQHMSAEFQGAAEDGSKVYFLTLQSLVPEDKDSGPDLYMARIGCGNGEAECEPSEKEVISLVQVSHASEPADVQDVVATASDGSHVYFVAHGILGQGANTRNGSPVKGADNLYVYDSLSGASPVFVADLCSGPEESGEVEDVRCPPDLLTGETKLNDAGLWVTHEPEAQTNTCSSELPTCESGRFLVFSTYARLTADDTDSAKDVYRYDAATDSLDRVSIGEAGYDANGNDISCKSSTCDATIAENHEHHAVYEQRDMDSRAIIEDGSRIVFTTDASLSPAAVNHLSNVYEWHEGPGETGGGLSLISTGSSDAPVEHVVISQSGQDIFFSTTQGLVSQDLDGASDVYDARLGGGFPTLATPRQPCAGDACQGPLTNPAPLLVPGSVTQIPGQNFDQSSPKQPGKPIKTKPKKKKTKKITGKKKSNRKVRSSGRPGKSSGATRKRSRS